MIYFTVTSCNHWYHWFIAYFVTGNSKKTKQKKFFILLLIAIVLFVNYC